MRFIDCFWVVPCDLLNRITKQDAAAAQNK